MKKSAILLTLLLLTAYAGCSQNKEQENDLSADETALVSESTETAPPETKATKATTTTTAATTTTTEQTTTEPPEEQIAPPVAQEQAVPIAPEPVDHAPAPPPPAPTVSSNEQNAIQTCESLGLVRDMSINYGNAEYAWGYALYGDTPVVNQVQQMQCGGYFNYFQHTDGYYYIGIIFDMSKPLPGASWVFSQGDVDWIINESKMYVESLGIYWAAEMNRNNGSWAVQIRNSPDTPRTTTPQGVLNAVIERIDYYRSQGYTSGSMVDYQHMGNGLYEFYVIYG